MTVALLAFFASGALIVAAGTTLARNADGIAERTRVGRVWIGAVLLAVATSLPELTTDVAAVRLGAPNLAAGDLFGSSLANMLLLAIIDLVFSGGRLLRKASFDHALAACLAIILNGLGALFVLAHTGRTFLGVGPESVLLVLVYLAGTRVGYRHSLRKPEAAAPAPLAEATPPASSTPTLRRAVLGFLLATVVIFAAAPVFAASARQIAEITGLGTTFVGTLLVGLSTSLPEFVTSLAAVRMGAFDLAVGNLFGSNAFNMVVFFAMDLAHPGGPVFAALDSVHALSALFAILLMSLGLAAIVYRPKRRFSLFEPGSVLMMVVYLVALLLLYAHTAGS